MTSPTLSPTTGSIRERDRTSAPSAASASPRTQAFPDIGGPTLEKNLFPALIARNPLLRSKNLSCTSGSTLGRCRTAASNARKPFGPAPTSPHTSRTTRRRAPMRVWSAGSHSAWAPSVFSIRGPTWRRCRWARELLQGGTCHEIRGLLPPQAGTSTRLVSSHEPRNLGGANSEIAGGDNAPPRFFSGGNKWLCEPCRF